MVKILSKVHKKISGGIYWGCDKLYKAAVTRTSRPQPGGNKVTLTCLGNNTIKEERAREYQQNENEPGDNVVLKISVVIHITKRHCQFTLMLHEFIS